MRKKRVCKAKYSDDSSPSEVKISIECQNEKFNVFFKSDQVSLSQPKEALITAVSMPCILNALTYANSDVVSKSFKGGLKSLGATLAEWGWATDLGKNLIEIETNLKDFVVRFGTWGEMHGLVLATVAHILSGKCRKVYIPSSRAHDQLIPWGTHPDLDPKWSSDQMEIVHDPISPKRIDNKGNREEPHSAENAKGVRGKQGRSI